MPSTKIPSSSATHDTARAADAPAPEGTRPPSTRAPLTRRNDGWLAGLKRKLAPRPVTVSNSLLGSVTTARPMTARAKIGVTPEQRHRPDPKATTQPAVTRHTRNVARTVAGASGAGGGAGRVGADALLVERGGTEAVAARLFNPAGLNGAHALPNRIASELRSYLGAPPEATQDRSIEAAARQELVLRRMAQAFGTDAEAAHGALDGLVAAGAPLAAAGAGFELARRLAASTLGHTTLVALCAHASAPAPALDLRNAAIRNDAERLAFTAANALIDALPEGAERPASMADVKRIALAALDQQGTPTMPAKALLAALQLAADPAAEPEGPLKSAYFAWRCGFHAEGPGTPLARAQHRLHKLSRYARRASNGGANAAVRRAFGFNKSPMSALAMGLGGAPLRQPDEEFEKANVVLQLADALIEQAQARDTALPGRIGAALKGATLEVWHQRIAHKGWRDRTTVTPGMRKAIAARAAELAGVRVAEVKLNPCYAEIKGHRSLLRPRGGIELGMDTLRTWVAELAPAAAEEGEAAPRSPAVDTLLAGVEQLARLEHNGEIALDASTPQTVLENFRRVISEPRTTYDVRLTDGGQFGINASVAELINLPIVNKLPIVLAGPDFKLVHARSAMINGGSSANHGQLFIGSDRRTSGHVGASATGGINLLHKNLLVSGTLQVLPAMLDFSQPKGIMVRTRLQPLGTAPAAPGQMDPWRAKMLAVVDAATASGPNGDLPADPATMWDAVSQAFYKDPDVSVNWLESRGSSVSSAVNLSGGARYEHNGYKVGPNLQIGGTKNWVTRTRRKETPGKLRAEYASSSSARAVGASLSLVSAFPPLGNFSDEAGHVKSVVLPSAAIIGFGTSVLQSETGSTWRIAEEDGHIDAAFSFRDTSFTSMAEMKRYVDSRRASWDRTYREQPAGAAAPEPIDEYLARVEQDATVGNQVFAERVWLRPDAARKINVLRELRDALVAPGARPGKEERAQIAARNAQIAALLESEQSWDNRFFYSLEVTGKSRALGPNFLAVLQRQTEVSHPHQLSVLRAERPLPPIEE